MASRIINATCLVVSFGLASTPALAGEYLTEVASEVYQTAGSPKDIAERASTCMSQNLKSGATDAQLIISSDLDGGIIVARSALSYPDGLLRWEVRSTLHSRRAKAGSA